MRAGVITTLPFDFQLADELPCASPRAFALGSDVSTRPQCPCDMYSHRQTSPISSRPGTSRLMARAAFCTMPSSAQAPVATSSFDLRQTEENDAGNAQRLHLGAFLYRFVDRQVVHAGHGAHFLANAFAGADEQRIDKAFRASGGFRGQRSASLRCDAGGGDDQLEMP